MTSQEIHDKVLKRICPTCGGSIDASIDVNTMPKALKLRQGEYNPYCIWCGSEYEVRFNPWWMFWMPLYRVKKL